MELVEITPLDSVVPVYREVLNEEEQAARDAEIAKMQEEQAQREAEIVAKEEAKQRAIAKLIALNLTEEEAKAMVGL